MTSILIKDGTIFDPSIGLNEIGDLLIVDGVIAEINPPEEKIGKARVIGASGWHIFPGFIDVHVHFRTPGEEHKETFESGMRAALTSGYTTVVQMPNTRPALSTPELVSQYTTDSPIHARVAASVTKNRAGIEINNLEELAKAGAVHFTDDGSPVFNDSIMTEALKISKKLKKRIASHSENLALSKGGAIIDSPVAREFDVRGIPKESEWSMVARDIDIAQKTGGLLHICHVSTSESVAFIETAKIDGVNVTAEATPHHLLLNNDAIRISDANAKMNPPLAYEEDRLALIDALSRGVIEIVATDHAPHTIEEKSQGLETAPFGIVGLETAFPLLYKHLVLTGLVSLETLILSMTHNPSKCFNLDGGTLKIGSIADIVIVDLETQFQVNSEKFLSKGKNTPFNGWDAQGVVKYTMVSGQMAYTAPN